MTAIRASDLPPTARLVALVVSCYMDADGRNAYPSQETIARDSGLSLRTVRTWIDRLIDLGWLTVARESSGRSSRRYKATVPSGVAPAPLAESLVATDAVAGQLTRCSEAAPTPDSLQDVVDDSRRISDEAQAAAAYGVAAARGAMRRAS